MEDKVEKGLNSITFINNFRRIKNEKNPLILVTKRSKFTFPSLEHLFQHTLRTLMQDETTLWPY